MSSSMPGKIRQRGRESHEKRTRLLRDFSETQGEPKLQVEPSFTFNRYRLERHNERLWRGNRLIPLTAKAFAVLRYLVEHAGQVVTKAVLFAALWPGIAVSEGALTFCIVEIRKALEDDARAPHFIETVHRRGYRFIAPVTTAPPRQPAKFSRPRAPCLPAPTLVGREAELAQLYSWFDRALRGERQLVFVTGEPGIGKTTLVDAFLHHAATRDLWLGRGQCIEQYGTGEAYMPILEAFGRLCRAPGGEHLITLLHQHAPTWLVQMPPVLPAAELEALQRKVQGATRERMLREMGEAVDILTAEQPVVLWLEDLHWSDVSTVELLALLVRRREPARLLVLGTYRPVDVIVQAHPLRTVKQELQLHGLCAELPLGLLSETQVAEYLGQRFALGAQRAGPLPELARLIHRHTDGNPLFMVAAVEDLLKQHVLVQEAGHWALHGELATVESRVPGNVQQLIEQQIERLSPEDRRVLEVASVAGMEFSAAAVAAGTETEAEAVEEQCARLARQEHFLRAQGTAEWPDGTVAARYAFLHALYHEVLYTRIAAGRRQRLHQRIGEREEHAYGERAREIAAELAVHFERGRDSRRAVQYLQHAGENALRRSAYVEALSLLNRGVELLHTVPDTPARAQQELALRIALGIGLIVTKGYAAPEVAHTYTRARALCQQLGETPHLFAVLLGLWVSAFVRAELPTARVLGEQLLTLAQRRQDPALRLEAHVAMGAVLLRLGEVAAARAHLEQAIALDQPRQPRPPLFLYGQDPGVTCRSDATWALWLLGYPDQASRQGQEALTLSQTAAHPFTRVFALYFAALLHQCRREGPTAKAQAEEVLACANAQGFAQFAAMGQILHGWALTDQGRGQEQEGITQLRRGLTAYRATGARMFLPTYLGLLAEAYGKTGQAEEGLRALDEALGLVQQSSERCYEAELYRLKGELLRQTARGQGQKTEMESAAEDCFRRAIDVARQQRAKSLELRAVMSLSCLWQQQGKREDARQRLAEIYGWFTEGFETKDLQEAKALLQELA
jgi:DNA-binding winged helix-turn-helix (wHTH) protein/predicted ATPase